VHAQRKVLRLLDRDAAIGVAFPKNHPGPGDDEHHPDRGGETDPDLDVGESNHGTYPIPVVICCGLETRVVGVEGAGCGDAETGVARSDDGASPTHVQ